MRKFSVLSCLLLLCLMAGCKGGFEDDGDMTVLGYLVALTSSSAASITSITPDDPGFRAFVAGWMSERTYTTGCGQSRGIYEKYDRTEHRLHSSDIDCWADPDQLPVMLGMDDCDMTGSMTLDGIDAVINCAGVQFNRQDQPEAGEFHSVQLTVTLNAAAAEDVINEVARQIWRGEEPPHESSSAVAADFTITAVRNGETYTAQFQQELQGIGHEMILGM